MRFSIDDEYVDFFTRNQCIEFEALLSEENLSFLQQKIQEQLLKNLRKKSLEGLSNTDLWKAGRDLWKRDPEIKKTILRSRVGEIASFLFKKRPIRLAYDQACFSLKEKDSPIPTSSSLKEISCMEPILGGVFLCLDFPVLDSVESVLPDIKRQRPGHGIFFTGDCPIPFPDFFQIHPICCLLICFTLSKVRYKLEPKDLHTHLLKKEGYAFGDLLTEETHPFLFH